jgi:ABC-2 type transport system ATP-binding protein
MTASISTHSLSRSFGRTIALDGVDLEVPKGSVYALVGANGAGKTTLIKVLMNIFRPSGGSAQVLGIDSPKVAGKVFQRIGYVSENQEMPDWMTTGEMLAYYRNFYPTWDRSLEQQLVRKFDLPLSRKLKHLSRGMRMKAAFASSLAYRPALIVLDEPFSGLDPLVRDELIEELIERAPETTIFLSSHDLAEIESFSTHVGFLEQGHLLFSEEMPVLTERFRQVTVTLAEPLRPTERPPSWLQFEAVESVVRFVHSHYEREATAAELAAHFPFARDITLDPMSLRSIFLCIAKSGRAQDSNSIPAPADAARETRV